ncbi:hypothetical protein J8F10_24535 [Gemmata sp. G18]|uniref:TubC N-terminal docking domain-containing protein n=1 Tax=Gemmata palustris TaxID=2822762 RepID=A0ABS5BXP2_9BACT|nr:hypothetical protein [Gemmata palustris]MBP3958428.1 hypothetical protein [Gemmata palustris]
MTTATLTVSELLTDLSVAGVRLWPEGRNIHYRSPSPLSFALKEAIIGHKPELLIRLAAWDASEAMQLEHAADGLVESLGISGNDPVIQEVAGRCVQAHHRNDMTGVRAACATIEDRARKVAKGRNAA